MPHTKIKNSEFRYHCAKGRLKFLGSSFHENGREIAHVQKMNAEGFEELGIWMETWLTLPESPEQSLQTKPNTKMTTAPQLTDAMSAMLKALGFEAMAKEIIGESDTERLTKYARVIIKNSPEASRHRLFQLFNSQNLFPKI